MGVKFEFLEGEYLNYSRHIPEKLPYSSVPSAGLGFVSSSKNSLLTTILEGGYGCGELCLMKLENPCIAIFLWKILHAL
jgi:hypothetical protein